MPEDMVVVGVCDHILLQEEGDHEQAAISFRDENVTAGRQGNYDRLSREEGGIPL